MRNRRSVLAAAGASCAAALLLTACHTNVGIAAKVGSTTITESDVQGYVTPEASPFADSNGQQILPKPYVLNVLIQDDLLVRAVAANGGPASSQELASARSAVLAGASMDQVTQSYTSRGFAAKTADVVVDRLAQQQVLSDRAGGSADTANSGGNGPDIVSLVNKLHIPVSVSPRYGTWNAAQLGVNTDGGYPAFLHLSSSAAPAVPQQ